jgi:hypothetical protein
VSASSWLPASLARDPSGLASCGPFPSAGHLILFGVSLLSVAFLPGVAAAGFWEENRTLWVGLGLFLVLLTVTRPWWFWENYKARLLRDLVGAEATTLFYLLVSAAMVWVGLFTNWKFGRH